MESNEMDWNVIEYDFPAPDDVVQKVRLVSNALAEMVCLSPDEIVASLRNQLRFHDLPHLTNLANAILDLPLSCLSVNNEQYWLTFNRSHSSLSISLAGTNEIPRSLLETFPISSVDGLHEFLRHFGGMADGPLPPGGYFWPPSEYVCVSSEDKRYDWGMVGEWAGSLVFYHGASGDMIVIHPDGYPGKWSHDIGWEMPDKLPFAPLDYSFAELIDHFVDYLSIPLVSPKREDSPFFY